MTDPDDLGADDYDDSDDCYDDDNGPWREPDPEDHEIAKAYEEHYEHCEQVHGGGECDCRPTRIAAAWQGAVRHARDHWRQARMFVHMMHTIRIGPLELTVRFRPPPACNACSGRGWFWTKGTIGPYPPPPGADGAALCGCGSAIARLADSRRTVRRMQNESPF